MTSLGSWLDERRPPPPDDLADRLRAEVGSDAGWEDAGVAAFARVGRTAMDEARTRTGRVRESAFHLLAADALFTYAAEAALEAEDPVAALRFLLEVGAGP